jgi:cation:H+ antiporter
VDVLYLFLGLGGLLAGAEMAVGGSLGLAKRWGWPSWVAGVILLALGTSLPEFFVALAAASEAPGLALGTVFGSNAINVGGVLGLMLILQPASGIPMSSAKPATLIALLLGSALAFGAFAEAEAHRLASAGLLVLFVTVLWSSLRGGAADAAESGPPADGQNVDLAEYVVGEGTVEQPAPLWRAGGQALLGFVLLAVASNLFLEGALGIAETLGWGAGFVGFLIAAAGTSAPELFTSIQAVRKGHAGAVFGNVLGSNAFNLLLVGGTTGVLAQAPLVPEEIRPQLWINLVACAVLVMPLLLRRGDGPRSPLSVAAGFVLVGAYIATAWWMGFDRGAGV